MKPFKIKLTLPLYLLVSAYLQKKTLEENKKHKAQDMMNIYIRFIFKSIMIITTGLRQGMQLYDAFPFKLFFHPRQNTFLTCSKGQTVPVNFWPLEK